MLRTYSVTSILIKFEIIFIISLTGDVYRLLSVRKGTIMTSRRINTRPVTLSVSPELYERMAEYKRQSGMNHSEMTRRALKQFLEGKVSE